MFAGMNFFMHESTPVLTMIAHVLFEDELSPRLTFKQSISGWIPVFIYGIFYVSLAVFTHVWPNFYGFNAGGMWYIAYPVMMLAGFGLGCGLWALQNKMRKAFTK